MEKVYIAGKIGGDPRYKEKFEEAEKNLLSSGYIVLNPAVLPEGFEHHQYMHICFAMIDVCDTVYMLRDWKDSKGASAEFAYVVRNGKKIMYQKEEKV